MISSSDEQGDESMMSVTVWKFLGANKQVSITEEEEYQA